MAGCAAIEWRLSNWLDVPGCSVTHSWPAPPLSTPGQQPSQYPLASIHLRQAPASEQCGLYVSCPRRSPRPTNRSHSGPHPEPTSVLSTLSTRSHSHPRLHPKSTSVLSSASCHYHPQMFHTHRENPQEGRLVGGTCACVDGRARSHVESVRIERAEMR